MFRYHIASGLILRREIYKVFMDAVIFLKFNSKNFQAFWLYADTANFTGNNPVK